MTGTSGRQRVQSEALRNFPIVKPSNQVLERLSEYVAGYFELIGTNERQSETLAATRDLLLPKLMSGEIRIKDAEKVVEMVL